MPAPRQLALMRHAKSSWKHPELADFDRPLNKRGLRDAPRMGKRLAQWGFRPDLIVTSPARRAAVTARTVAECLDYPLVDIVEDASAYLADPDTLLDIVHGIDDRFLRIMLFGHNPGFTQLANLLGDFQTSNMPTAAIALFEFDAEHWRNVSAGDGRMQLYDFPKNTDKS